MHRDRFSERITGLIQKSAYNGHAFGEASTCCVMSSDQLFCMTSKIQIKTEGLQLKIFVTCKYSPKAELLRLRVYRCAQSLCSCFPVTPQTKGMKANTYAR